MYVFLIFSFSSLLVSLLQLLLLLLIYVIFTFHTITEFFFVSESFFMVFFIIYFRKEKWSVVGFVQPALYCLNILFYMLYAKIYFSFVLIMLNSWKIFLPFVFKCWKNLKNKKKNNWQTPIPIFISNIQIFIDGNYWIKFWNVFFFHLFIWMKMKIKMNSFFLYYYLSCLLICSYSNYLFIRCMMKNLIENRHYLEIRVVYLALSKTQSL